MWIVVVNLDFGVLIGRGWKYRVLLSSLCWIELDIGVWGNVESWWGEFLVEVEECVGERFYCILVVVVVCVRLVMGKKKR